MDYKPHSSRGKWKRCCSSCPICHTSIYFQRAFTPLERVQQLESHQYLRFLFKIHWIFFSNSSISTLYQSSCWVFPGAQIHLMKFLHVGKAWCYDIAFMGKWVYGWCRKGDPYAWTYTKTHEDLGVLIDPESGVQPFHPLIEGDWKNDACWGQTYSWHL